MNTTLTDDQLLADLGVPEIPEIPWPHNGQEFDVEIVVTGGGEYELDVELSKKDLAPEVSEVFSAVGVNQITGDLFIEEEIPTQPGRYAARLRFVTEDRVDWETGINDPDFGFEIVHCRMKGFLPTLRRAGAKMLDALVKAPVRWLVRTWPSGYLCDFHWEGQGRIRLTKDLLVIIGGETKNDSADALPISFVSEKLVKRVAEELNGKWYMPAAAAQK